MYFAIMWSKFLADSFEVRILLFNCYEYTAKMANLWLSCLLLQTLAKTSTNKKLASGIKLK